MIVFGPVFSRRFGTSLGVDLSPGLKQCNFNCVYCELEKAKPVSAMRPLASPDEILSEIKTALSKHENIDVLTLTANGEPTLYPFFGELVRRIKQDLPGAKLLVLSNATRIRENLQALLQCDIVKFSLDSAVQKTFEKIDGARGIAVVDVISAVRDFSAVYKGELILEILVVAGLNDTAREMQAIQAALLGVKFARADLASIDRPPAFNVKGVSYEDLKALAAHLPDLPVSIVQSPVYKQKNYFEKSEILEMLKRRPQSTSDVAKAFNDAAQANLQDLLARKKIKLKNNFFVLA